MPQFKVFGDHRGYGVYKQAGHFPNDRWLLKTIITDVNEADQLCKFLNLGTELDAAERREPRWQPPFDG